MSIDIKVPVLPESVSDATVAKWYKKEGDVLKRDEHLVDIETDKVVLEVVAPQDGTLEKILKAEGSVVKAEEVIGLFKEGALEKKQDKPTDSKEESQKELKKVKEQEILSPSERRQAKEKEIERAPVAKTAEVTKEPIKETKETKRSSGKREERRVPMTRLRAKIAERLVEAQHTAAILTTFNEVNMQPIMLLRQKYKDIFEKTHGVRLGLMSFFTVAVVEALKHFPIINASVEGNDIVYHDYEDIGIAVSTQRGLVVPVLRDAETLSMADIEKKISDFAKRAETGHLTLEEITGGTFTITNGGVFGSLMATPILNPPQSGILGMHKIEERPVVENGQIVIRPMMYVALSYDHRIIDGVDSVKFLVMVKALLEEPARMALGI